MIIHKLNVTSGMGIIPATARMKSAKAEKGAVTVSWKKAKDANKYYVYRKTGKDGKWEKIATTTKTSYKDKSAKKGKTYYYKVKGYNKKSKITGDDSYNTVKAKAK